MLWAHQAAAVGKLLAHKHFGLWWEPGTGKTAPLAVAGRDAGGRSLWIVPASLRSQAAKEIARFRADGAKIQIVRSGKDKIEDDAVVVVCSYELARHIPIWKQLMRVRWSSLVIDEAHKLANTKSVQTQAIYGARADSNGALIRSAERVWISTGTPIVNHADGLFSHFSRLWPELGPTRKAEWIDRFCVVQKDLFGERIVGSKNHDELRSMLRRAGSRLRLRDVHDMPPLVIDEISVDGGGLDLSDFPPDVMQRLEEAINAMDGDELGWSLSRAESLAPALATLRKRLALAKAPMVADLVKEERANGADRILVFSQHVDAVQEIAARIPGAAFIIGQTRPTDRDIGVAQFNSGEVPVLVAQAATCGVGLNMQSCRRIVFVDAAWTPSANEQAIARCYRAGQERPVHVSFVSLAESVDERVQGALARKASAIRRMQD
jgi:SNF2 family DNA or RNA helicase